MKEILKRSVSALLTFCLLAGLIPAAALPALAASDSVYTIRNGSIQVDVSGANGGFTVTTGTGDKLNKADDNKALLYHSGQYDTSFTSFEVTYNPGAANEYTKDYLFGGDYGFLGLSSSAVTVQKVSDSEITAQWSLDTLTFLQDISLVASGANEHGMASISYAVQNSGSTPVKVKARVLLDTALGSQDYAYYEVIDQNQNYRSIHTETVLTASDSIPQNFFGYDDPYNPTVTAYTVNSQSCMPYQAAFGHWNNLAATIFDFAPDSAMNFTDPYNGDYLTADSAYALYYDLGSVAASGGNSSFLTYYGVYSHQDVPAGNSMTVDVSSPTALALNDAGTAYVRKSSQGAADFEVQTELTNFVSDAAKAYSSVTLAVYTADGLMPLDSGGNVVSGLTYADTDPYTVSYADVAVGQTVSDVLYFKARADSSAQYRKIRLEVYDTSSGAALTEQNLLGSAVFYLLCPGTNGELPKFTFTSLTPGIIYYSGTRHLFLTGTNIDLLYTSLQNGNCTLKAYTKNPDDDVSVTVRKENVLQPETNQLDIILPDEMVTGDWYLQLEWADSVVGTGTDDIVTPDQKDQTAPALRFTVTDDKSYKNDTYGVIAVVQTAKAGATTTPTYRIKSFSGESTFQTYQKSGDYVEILLVLRGEFEVKETALDGGAYVPTRVTATSLKSSVDAKATNTVSINNCMDFENGVLTVSYASTAGGFGNIRVEFDGDLYTSDSRTSIWKGEAALTEIEQGQEFSLIPYDEDGERNSSFTDNPISLVWPSVFGVGQTIAGMVFNLAYGQLGVMQDSNENEVGRVISFSAKLDLGFLIPDKENGKTENTYWTRLQNFWKFYQEGKGGMYSYWAVENVDNILDFSKEESGKDEGSASVMVQDILYGCGTGFVGVHFNVDIALPNYVEGMPKIKGTLEVNTIGNWSFGLDGAMKMATFTLEVSLSLKSYNNIPVPDKIYFFVGGFEPGINVDGCGVIWITGGGGGIDKLYDTIFLDSGVPPLKILLSVSFDLLKVLSARADFSISLTGLSFTATDVEIKGTNLVALEKAAAEFDWYPDLYLMGSIRMNLFDLIHGSGYLVLQGKNYSDWFFEAFVRAGVSIPKSIPIVGGMNIAQVDLGINTQRIWGVLSVLSIKLGLTYYWGGTVNFGTGGGTAQPTYPNLLGCEDVPVYYDEENDRTLYMRVGTNLTVAAQAEVGGESATVPKLMGTAPSLGSSGDRLTHRFNLGDQGSDSALIQVSFDVASQEEAQNIANEILAGGIQDDSHNKYAVILYDGTNAETANANVTYDSSTGKGALAFTMTESSCYNKDWSFTTPVAADVVLYNVAPVPELTSVSGTLNGAALDLTWTGSGLSDLDSVKFYLVSDKDDMNDSGYPLAELADPGVIASGAAGAAVPANVPSGSYYIRAIYVQDGVINGVVTSEQPVTISNSHTPSAPSVSSVSPGGDLKFDIGLSNPSADAYVVNIYHSVYDSDTGTWSWAYSDVNGMVFDTSDLTNGTITVGGSYTYSGETHGLAAGTAYRIGLTACNYVDSDGDGTNDTAVYSAERYYSSSALGGTVADVDSATSVTLPAPTPPAVTLTADKTAQAVTRTVGTETQTFDTYSSADLTFTAASSEAVTGTWALDEGNSACGTFSGQTTVNIALTGLSEGDHTLVLKGSDAGGDGFRKAYSFTVDTLAPKLLLSSPTNGSFFNEDGTLTVAGSTDADALFTVTCDGVLACAGKSISQLGGTIDSDGTFSFTLPLPDAHSASSHHVTITASDAVGNLTGREADVFHGGLSDIAEVSVYADGVKWSNGNLNTNSMASRTSQLELVATTRTGVSFVLTDESMVSWTCNAVEGTASITDGGLLTMGADSVGFATGSLRVASSGSLQASLTFGAERYGGSRQVVVGTSLGGSVTGAGAYDVGDSVTLTAVPDTGYSFTGWTISGVTVSSLSSAAITFDMPDGSVVATAHFSAGTSGGLGTGGYSVTATAGEKVLFPLPDGADENRFVAYYLSGGQEMTVPMSAVIGGYLVFVAPVTGTYYLEQRSVSFPDTTGHWAEPYIAFEAARGLFGGIGDGRFDPDGTMTRAMFVTVLWRLAGKPSAGTGSQFGDVATGQWYSQAVAWAAENGIVNGYDSGLFGLNDNVTREQMCTIFLRYLKALGLELPAASGSSGFADEGSVSSWAEEAVCTCRDLGIINGKDSNLFDPQGVATRAEGCAAFCRLIKAYLNSI